MIRIACLHTAESNVAVLDDAAAAIGGPGMALSHVLRADLLEDMEAAGALTPAIRARGEKAIAALLADHDRVLITCSSIGALADGRLVQRVDGALAEEAVRRGRRVVVLCASPTTVGPTTDLFATAAAASGAEVDIRLIEGAWALFCRGAGAGYFRAIAHAAAGAIAGGADVVALAQVSMSGAVALQPEFFHRILAAPQVALRRMMQED